MTDIVSSLLAAIIRLLTGVRAYRIGSCQQAAAGPAVYFSNHSSHIDTLIVWAALPKEIRRRLRPVAAKDFWEASPIRRLAARSLRCLLIERRKIDRSSSPMPLLSEALEHGDSILIFPQGTRRSGNGIRFKNGIFHICKANPGLPCVPVYLENVSRILPAGEILPVPIIASLYVGPSISLQPGESKTDFIKRAEDSLNSLIP